MAEFDSDMSENITMAIRNQRMSGGFICAISLLGGGIGIIEHHAKLDPIPALRFE
ncbi:MAG: hypothetical protein L0Z50_15050 [Verrucomicrobiales bacterium]|nr:hypothetical protein [Verrucomicrobiales bacterium]